MNENYVNLIDAIKTGDINQTAQSIEAIRKADLQKLLEHPLVGVIMIHYAIKGKIGMFGRSALLIFGTAFLYSKYRQNQSFLPDDLKTIHPIIETVIS